MEGTGNDLKVSLVTIGYDMTYVSSHIGSDYDNKSLDVLDLAYVNKDRGWAFAHPEPRVDPPMVTTSYFDVEMILDIIIKSKSRPAMSYGGSEKKVPWMILYTLALSLRTKHVLTDIAIVQNTWALIYARVIKKLRANGPSSILNITKTRMRLQGWLIPTWFSKTRGKANRYVTLSQRARESKSPYDTVSQLEISSLYTHIKEEDAKINTNQI
ncbi:hypothetical protein IEQ34_017453 [Dendrobium chrysotoxum]|uniref:Uncharacterized protein n=1 Tax=Dendrobium chrysotoxum TaxID=161865 RepID=A0AAV7GBC4_DENCH|nr:hypothetical protein IEQ34_017453 [Dendrobium chrysotoxum]